MVVVGGGGGAMKDVLKSILGYLDALLLFAQQPFSITLCFGAIWQPF